MVKKIWHFIGLPDPEENIERKKVVNTPKTSRITSVVENEKIEEKKSIHKQHYQHTKLIGTDLSLQKVNLFMILELM